LICALSSSALQLHGEIGLLFYRLVHDIATADAGYIAHGELQAPHLTRGKGAGMVAQ